MIKEQGHTIFLPLLVIKKTVGPIQTGKYGFALFFCLVHIKLQICDFKNLNCSVILQYQQMRNMYNILMTLSKLRSMTKNT